MDEDNNDTPRVTRARTRRMSALETERPLTPQLDIIAERASPRPTRRTRLNSSTIDLRTPVRSTRLSLARGESLEPITPTASSLSTAKRPTRTPAKSGRKQLTLQEELKEEDASEVAVVETKRTTATAAKSVRKQLTLQEDVKEEQAASTETKMAVVKDVPKVEAKPSARTPAKSVRNQLTIQEDNNEDQVESTDTKMTEVNVEAKPSARTPAKQAESTDTKMEDVVEEVAEVVVESTPTRSGPIDNESTPPSNDRPVTRSMSKTPPVRVTRSMSKTPPARGRSANNTPVNTQNSPKMEPKRSNKKQIKDTSVSEQPQMQSTEAINDKSVTEAINDKSVTEPHVEVELMEIDEEEIIDKSKSESNSNVNESSVIATSPKVIHIEQNIPEQMKELNEIIPQNEEPAESESNKENIQHFDESKDKIDPKSSSVDVEEKLERNSPPSTVATELYQLDASFVNDDVGANITVTDDIRLTDVAIVTKVVRLPDLTPTTKGLLMEQSCGSESRKTVAFNDGMRADDDAKPKYPKTPARLNEPPVKSVNLITGKNENETPLKRLLKGRNSSTPVTKSQVLLSQADVEPKTPPLQIDVIQPFSALKDEDNNISLDLPITTAKLSRRLLSEDENEVETENNTYGNRSVRYSDDEYHEAEDATSHDRSNCEFFDMEAECIEDYQSGDSMNSSERREVVENEIPHDGESVGSQDTPDEHSEEEDSAEEKMSFIVTDSEEEADDDEDDKDDGDAENDDDGGDIECLCFSSASDEDVFDPDEDKPKKYRRIISNDSSDDDDDEQINNMEINTDDKEVKVTEKQVNKSVSSVEEDEDEKQLPIKTPLNTNESEKAEITEDVNLNGEDEEMEVEELVFSSDDENESPKSKKNISYNKSIYEVLDSCDDESDQLNKTAGPIADNLNLTAKKEEPSEPNEKPPVLDDDEKALSTSNNEPSSTESVATVSADASTFHEKQKRSGEEEALLAEISSCDLSHLHQMFNPLQKSRRQTLYVQDVPITTKEPKLKRRSVQLNSDVQPSQSFIETLAEEKRQQSKRKHMSKSFCGAADDDGLDISGDVVEEVQRKKARKSEVARIDIIEPDVEAAKDEAKLSPSKEEKELPAAQAQEEENMPVAQDEPELETKLSPTKDVMKSSPVSKMDTNENQPDQKNRNFYLDYCDSILQAANEAKLQQKKQRVAGNKKIKRERSASVTNDAIDTTASTSTATVHQEKAKKDLKRLQATKQAFKHAVKLLVPKKAITGDAIDIAASTSTATLKLEKVKIEKDLERLQALKQAVKHSEQLLVPETANRPASVTGDAIETTPSTSTATVVSLEKAKIKKDLKRLQATKPPVKQLLVPEAITNQPQQSQSLARKLSSQPDAKTKAGKTKRKLNKKKKQKLMTQLSSDEESRNDPYRFRNNAGIVTVTEDGSSEDDDIITNSGIVKVEPCTPMPKYFKEIPVTPVGSGFRSEPNKKKPKAEHSAATAAALRFKMKMFGGDK